MSFLLDTDTCSYYLKNHRKVTSKVMLHFGSLGVSVITAGQLFTWSLRANAPVNRHSSVEDFLTACALLPIDLPIAYKFGALRALMFDQGKSIGETDLLIAATALVHDLTLVTHNTQDFAGIPDLRLDDWTA